MLGPLLRVGEHLAGEAAVLDRSGPARARPRDRIRDDVVAGDGDERLRTRADDGPVVVPSRYMYGEGFTARSES